MGKYMSISYIFKQISLHPQTTAQCKLFSNIFRSGQCPWSLANDFPTTLDEVRRDVLPRTFPVKRPEVRWPRLGPLTSGALDAETTTQRVGARLRIWKLQLQ